MSQWQLTSVEDGSGNLHLKFGQNRVSNSWDIPDMDKSCMDKNVPVMVGICSRCSQQPIFGQMLPGQMLPRQMSPWQLESVHEGPRNLHLKFGQIRASNSWDIADIEFSVVVVVGGGGVKSFSCKIQT